MRIIKKEEKIIAIVFDGTFEDGTKPLTPEAWPLQVIALNHPAGKKLVAHSHCPTTRTTENLMEALMVFSGVVNVSVYSQNELIEVVTVRTGQGVMIVDGGIGIEVIEDAKMMEFKNGPFVEDKVLLE